MSTTTAAAPLTAADTLLGINAYADLTKKFTKHMAWMNACRAYSTRKAIGEPYNPEPKGMPSKASKYQMYADADRVIRSLHLDVKRPTTLPEIADVIAAATAVLMAR